MRVLFADDEVLLADTVAEGLRKLAMAVDVCYDGAAAMERLGVNRYDVAVLDRDMPGRTGDEVCRRIVGSGATTRVLLLTAAAGIRDRVEGLGLGADDYLTKPFALEELLARLRALLRRSHVPTEDDPDAAVLTFSDLNLNPLTREVRRGDRHIDLTRTEFTLLEMFMRRPRRVLDRSFILEEVWGYDFPTTANSLEVYVGYLRRKTEAGDEPRLIHTVRGVGYVLREGR